MKPANLPLSDQYAMRTKSNFPANFKSYEWQRIDIKTNVFDIYRVHKYSTCITHITDVGVGIICLLTEKSKGRPPMCEIRFTVLINSLIS